MADNVNVNGVDVATRSVTYSGDAARNLQVMGLATVAGSDDAKTATDVSPTNGLPVAAAVPTAATGSWTTGLSTAITLDVTGMATATIQAVGTSATGAAVATFEVSADGGVTYKAVSAIDISSSTGVTLASVSGNVLASTTNLWQVPVSGLTHIRVAFSGVLSSGSGAFRIAASAVPSARFLIAVKEAASGGIKVDASSSNLNAIVQTVTVNSSAVHDNPITGSEVMFPGGGAAVAHGSNPTAVAAGDYARFIANRAGVPFSIGGHPNVQTFRSQFTAAQTDVALVTVATGLKIVLTRLTVTLDNASTVFPSCRIGFGTANTPTGAGTVAAHGGLPAGGGMNIGDGSGMLGVGADNEDLRITTVGAATGNGVEVCGSYYTIES